MSKFPGQRHIQVAIVDVANEPERGRALRAQMNSMLQAVRERLGDLPEAA